MPLMYRDPADKLALHRWELYQALKRPGEPIFRPSGLFAPKEGLIPRVTPSPARFLSSILLPFLVYGPLINIEYYEKGYPYCRGTTQEP